MPCPSGARIIAMVERTSLRPISIPTSGPSTIVSPSSLRPSSMKNALVASRSSTTMRTLSIRLTDIFFPSSFARDAARAFYRKSVLSGGCLLNRLVGPRPLSNRPAIATPPRTGLVGLNDHGGVFPRLLPAVRGQVQELEGGQHGFDPSPLRFIRLEHPVVSPQVAAKVAAVSGGQRRA